jgi:Zn-dependent protease
VSTRISPWFLLLIVIAVIGGVLAAFGTTAFAETGSTTLMTAGVVLLVLGGWAVSLCLHEFGHAYVALRNGDWTVRNKGYLTLDIRRYSDIGWSFVLPIVFLLLGGIPLPGGAVWINHGLLRSRLGRSLVSLAGPATNLVLGAILTVAVAFVSMPVGLQAGLSCLALIQVLAFVLNILPVPGLDGFGALEPYLPAQARRFADTVSPYAIVGLFLLIITVPAVAQALFGAGSAVFVALGGDRLAADVGFGEFLFWR